MADHPDRIAPHDFEAEAAILSAVLIDPEGPSRVAPIVAAEDFYAERHRRIFEAAMWLFERAQPVDAVQVATRLRDEGRLSQVGGMEYMTEVLNAAPCLANLEAYAETVAKKARVRQMIWTCQRIASEGYSPQADEDGFLDHAEELVHAISESARRKRVPIDTMRSVLRRVFTKLQDQFERAGAGITGITTGFEAWDQATGGLHDGESLILAARPGMGKTALAMSVAQHVAARGYGVVVFSLEMPNEQIATRTLCSAARVDVRKARTNRFDLRDWSALTAAVAQAADPEHFYLVDQPCGLLDVRSIARARAADMQRASKKLGLIVVDYLQLMNGRDGVSNREQAVSENARGLKLVAKELGCPVIVLSQLNRGVETRTDKRPMLSDLRESGAIEEAADCVVGMYRDDYYHEQSKTPGVVELILLKHRHGPTGTVEVGFDAPTVTFRNLESGGGQWAAQ